VIEEKPIENHQQDKGANPEGITAPPSEPAPIPPQESVVTRQQTGSQATTDSGTRQQEQPAANVKKELSTFDRKIIRVTWVGVFVAATTGVILFLQFREAGKQTRVLSDQAKQAAADSVESGTRVERQLALSDKQASAAQDSVRAIQKQVQIVRENFVEGERPFIWIVGPQIPDHPLGMTIVAGKKAEWNYNYTNYGKSPAIGVAVASQVVLSGRDGFAKLDENIFKNLHRPHDNTMGMIVPPEATGNWGTAFSKDILTPDDVSLIPKTNGGIAIFIHFEYFDSFGNEYHSETCEFRYANGAIGNCAAHNRIRQGRAK
jgi:hypothetical protein